MPWCKSKLLLISTFILLGCKTTIEDSVVTAQPYIGLQERQDRKEIRELVGVDPVRTEWCAAFVNAVLNESGIPGSESVSNVPLMARSFLTWGETIQDPKAGDLVVFPRGKVGWQGHVGFYVGSIYRNDVEYYRILGGNQNNSVNIEIYPASKALGIRRAPE